MLHVRYSEILGHLNSWKLYQTRWPKVRTKRKTVTRDFDIAAQICITDQRHLLRKPIVYAHAPSHTIMDIEEATKEAELAAAAGDMPEKKAAAGLGNMAESTLVFDPATSEIVWTADVGDDDVVLRDKVSHNCSGVLISLDPHTRNPASAYNPAVNIAEWKPQAAEGDFARNEPVIEYWVNM